MREFLGCGNHGCSLEPPRGMGTNGGCHCLDGLSPEKRRRVRRYILRLESRIKELETERDAS